MWKGSLIEFIVICINKSTFLRLLVLISRDQNAVVIAVIPIPIYIMWKIQNIKINRKGLPVQEKYWMTSIVVLLKPLQRWKILKRKNTVLFLSMVNGTGFENAFVPTLWLYTIAEWAMKLLNPILKL